MSDLADRDAAGPAPRRPVRLPVFHQTWRHTSFLHWRVDEGDLRPLLPPALAPSIRHGSAWVSLVLFCADDSRPVPGVPALAPFAQTNVRTYVETAGGREGLWFLDLEAASTVAATAGRGIVGPYHHSDARLVHRNGLFTYVSHRDRGVGHDIAVTVAAAAPGVAPTDFDHWLTGRWRGYSRRAGVTLETYVAHEPWQLRPVETVRLDENLLATLGIDRRGAPDVAHHGGTVHARFSLPRPVAGR